MLTDEKHRLQSILAATNYHASLVEELKPLCEGIDPAPCNVSEAERTFSSGYMGFDEWKSIIHDRARRLPKRFWEIADELETIGAVASMPYWYERADVQELRENNP